MKSIIIYPTCLLLLGCLFGKKSSKSSYTSFDPGNYSATINSIRVTIKIEDFNEMEIDEYSGCLAECKGNYRIESGDSLIFSNRECRYENGIYCQGDSTGLFTDWIADSTVSYPLRINNHSSFEIIYLDDMWIAFDRE